MKNIDIPNYAKITDYRTMTPEKKLAACNGNKIYQNEWMTEEINEFYEAINNNNKNEIFDEAMGLIRTAQQFSQSKRVSNKWNTVKYDIFKVFNNKNIFLREFKKWHKKKLLKNQARNVKPEHLINFAGLKF